MVLQLSPSPNESNGGEERRRNPYRMLLPEVTDNIHAFRRTMAMHILS